MRAIALLVLSLAASGAAVAQPFSDATFTAGGAGHTCALTTAGGVKCWGNNSSFQSGAAGIYTVPTTSRNLTSGVVQLAVGTYHNCVRTDAGGVKCWGQNSRGQLGNGSTGSGLFEGLVTTLASGSNAIALAAGDNHTCAIVEAQPGDGNGTVKCWGENASGQLGQTNSGGISKSPTPVVGLASNAMAIAAGGSHTCALLIDFTIQCWGANDGRLGNGSTEASITPVTVAWPGGLPVKIFAGFESTCAITDTGVLRCWGTNAFGTLGDGTTEPRLAPVDVVGFPGFADGASLGVAHTCAWNTAGALYCWGRNTIGQLGNGQLDDSPTPVLTIASNVVNAAGRYSHTCATSNSGPVLCWGFNTSGQLGLANNLAATIPIHTLPLHAAATSVSAGLAHTCASLEGGGATCWGANESGQLGRGSRQFHPLPSGVLRTGGLETTDAAKVTAGATGSCMLTQSGGVRCWGDKPGNGSASSDYAADVTGLASGATAVEAGDNHACAVTASGGVQCWGANARGQLGNGTTNTSLVPVDVPGVANVLAISAGDLHTCAIVRAAPTDPSGPVKCWGANNIGQLGIVAAGDRSTPAEVSMTTIVGAVSISAGRQFTCAVLENGRTMCWGQGYQNFATEVSGATSGIASVSTGGPACVVSLEGEARCWGNNAFGAVGDGTRTNRTPPPLAVKGLERVLSITAGGLHTCALTVGGRVKCWGDPTNAQLGNGNYGGYELPAAVQQVDAVPEPFSFPVLNGVAPSTLQVSSPATITGIAAAVPVNVYDGEYSIGCTGTFTSDPGTISSGDTVCVRHTSGSGAGQTVATTLVAGTTYAEFISTTTRPAQSIDFAPQPDRPHSLLTTTVSASASSGLPVAFTSMTIGICKAVGTVITFHAAGTCTIRASQAGNAAYLAAPNVDRSFAVTAHPQYRVTVVIAGTGGGNVSFPGVLACPPACSAMQMGGTAVTLTATADNLSTFTGWSGGTCSGTAPCSFPLDADVTVTATFVARLAQTIDFGELRMRALPESPFPVSATATSGLPVSFLSATLDVCTVSGNIVTLLTTGLCAIRANQAGDATWLPASMVQRTFLVQATLVTLSAQKTGSGTGTVTSSPAGIDCGSDCTEAFPIGTTVTLTATPAAGTTFMGWSGVPCSGMVFTNPTCTFTLIQDLTATAAFESDTVRVSNDLDGDGKSDLVWTHADGRIATWLMNGLTKVSASVVLGAGTGWTVTHVADFDGDGKADLLFRNTDGRAAIWLMNGNVLRDAREIMGAGTGWTVERAADLNGDGKADLLWHHADGRTAAWLMNGLDATAVAELLGPGTGWSVSHTGDLNGDRRADLVWRNTDGRVAAWLMNGLAPTQAVEILGAGTGWSVAHVADLDGDGKSDLVWQHTDGSVVAWLMNGTAQASAATLLGTGAWSVVGTADVDGDGKSDLIWSNTDGAKAIWLMNGLSPSATAIVLAPGTGWSFVRKADLNGDFIDDLVWHHTDGTTIAWLMNGLTFSNSAVLFGAGSPWNASTAGP